MQVVLENINSEPEIPESAEPEAVEAPPEPQELADAEPVPAPEPPPRCPRLKSEVGLLRQRSKLRRQLPK